MNAAPEKKSNTVVSDLFGSYRLSILIFLILALVPVFARYGAEGFILDLVNRAIILALAAIALDLILGYGGMVSFGHAAFIGIGAYVTAIMVTEGFGEALIIFPMVLVISGLFALVTGIICLRTSGVYFIMITLAFGQMLFFAASSLSTYGGDDGLTIWGNVTILGSDIFADDVGIFYISLGFLIAGLFLVQALVGSRFGRVLRAAKENETRVSALGYNVLRVRLTAYVIAGMIAGIAGFLHASQAEFVSPATMRWQHSGELIIMVALGGMGTRNGALIGALAYVFLIQILSDFTHDWKLIFGPLMVLAVLSKNGGIGRFFDYVKGGRNRA